MVLARARSWLARRRGGPATAHAPAPAADIAASAVLYPTASVHLQGRGREAISVGAHSHIRGELLVFRHGGRIGIGDYCYIGEQTRLWSAASISIGNRVLISHLCTIMDNLTHPEDPEARHAQFRHIIERGFPEQDDLGERPVVIEDDALIGCSCVILRGVTIGAGAIIGAGSVVTGDVPAMTVYVGNPARFVRPVAANEQRG